MTISDSAVQTIRPHRQQPDKPDAFADRTSMSLTGSSIVVHGSRGEELTFPLSGGHGDDHVVTAMALTLTDTLDQAAKIYDARVEFLNRHRLVVGSIPGRGWDRDELSRFAAAAGVPFSVDTLSSWNAYSKAYRAAPGKQSLTAKQPGDRTKMFLYLILPIIVLLVLSLVFLG